MTTPDSPPSKIPVWMVTTAAELHGYRIVSSFGVVMGLALSQPHRLFDNESRESRAIQIREEAFASMTARAASRGANAIVAMRFDSGENTSGFGEVVAYGTAVVVEPAQV